MCSSCQSAEIYHPFKSKFEINKEHYQYLQKITLSQDVYPSNRAPYVKILWNPYNPNILYHKS